jgi:hypothetical protein
MMRVVDTEGAASMTAETLCPRAKLLRAAGEILIATQLTTKSPRLDYAWLNSLFATPDPEEG